MRAGSFTTPKSPCLLAPPLNVIISHPPSSPVQLPAPCAQDDEWTPTFPMIEAGREFRHRPDGEARVQVHGRSQPVEQQMEALLLLNRSATQVRRAAVCRPLQCTLPPTLSPPSTPHVLPLLKLRIP